MTREQYKTMHTDRTPRRSWTKIDMRTSEMVCEGCGGREKLELPAEASLVVQQINTFGTAHCACGQAAQENEIRSIFGAEIGGNIR